MRRRGLTMTEVIVTIAIIGILVATSFFILGRMGKHLHLSGVVLQFKQDCSLARQLALEKNKPFLVRCYPGSDPPGWEIVRFDSLGHFTVIDSFRLTGEYRVVRFGVSSDVSGTGPDGNPIPSDGVSFPADAIAFVPRQGCPQPGVVYFTNGKETQAVMVTAIGTAVVMRYVGNGQWQ